MKTIKDFQADAAYYAHLARRQGALVKLTIEAMDSCGIGHAYTPQLAEQLQKGAMKAWRLAEMAVSNGYVLPEDLQQKAYTSEDAAKKETHRPALVRKFITSIAPYDPRIANEVGGFGIGFPHVGLRKIAEEMGFGTTYSTFGTVNVFSSTLKAWNGCPLQLGWIVEVSNA
jgi:hypothetical protein